MWEWQHGAEPLPWRVCLSTSPFHCLCLFLCCCVPIDVMWCIKGFCWVLGHAYVHFCFLQLSLFNANSSLVPSCLWIMAIQPYKLSTSFMIYLCNPLHIPLLQISLWKPAVGSVVRHFDDGRDVRIWDQFPLIGQSFQCMVWGRWVGRGPLSLVSVW